MTLGKHLGLLLPAFALLLLSPPPVFADDCSCFPRPTVLDAFEGSDHVVVVRGVSVEKDEKYMEGVKSITMRVERVYKGDLKVGAELTFPQPHVYECIRAFSEGYVGYQSLFYLSTPERGGKDWHVAGCSRSTGLRHAGDDLLYLNKLDSVRGRTRLSGRLRMVKVVSDVGRLLRVSGGGKTYEVRTGANGLYELYDLPPGKYTVEPEIPPGLKLDEYHLLRFPSPSVTVIERNARGAPTRIEVSVEAGRHAGLDLVFDMDNAVRGVVSDPEGRPVDDVRLDLVTADTWEEIDRDYTGQDGRFEIDKIWPDRYVLAVTVDAKTSDGKPSVFYYPGAKRREDATVFKIGLGDFVEGLRVVVPPETVTVGGVFLYSDGKPVAGESVVFKAANAAEGVDGDARTQTDAEGRFSFKIWKGMKGSLYGEMNVYVGEFRNCRKLEKLIKQVGPTNADFKTPAVEFLADENVNGVKLKFTFPACRKAKVE